MVGPRAFNDVRDLDRSQKMLVDGMPWAKKGGKTKHDTRDGHSACVLQPDPSDSADYHWNATPAEKKKAQAKAWLATAKAKPKALPHNSTAQEATEDEDRGCFSLSRRRSS